MARATRFAQRLRKAFLGLRGEEPRASAPALLAAVADRCVRAVGVDPDALPRPAAAVLRSWHRQSGAELRRGAAERLADVPDAVFASPGALGEARLAAVPDATARKRGGLYYTPRPVAEALVGYALPGGARASALVLDPACGAGALLLAAFDRLVESHVAGGMARSAAASHVLACHLYGTDLDALALACARFGLALAAARCGAREAPEPHLGRADALRPGGPAGFPTRFDVLIANPPFLEGRALSPGATRFLKARYRSAAGKVNAAGCFLERGLGLLAPGGRLAYVVPQAILSNARYAEARAVLLAGGLDRVVALDRAPFAAPVVNAALVFARRPEAAGTGRARARRLVWIGRAPGAQSAGRARLEAVPVGRLESLPARRIHFAPADALELFARLLERGVPLGGVCEVRDGISTGFAHIRAELLGRREGGAFVAESGRRARFDPERHRPVFDGAEFAALSPIRWRGRYVEYDRRWEREPAPPAGRPVNCQLREPGIFDRPEKLVSRQTARRLTVTLDRGRRFARNSVHSIYAREGAEADLAALALFLSTELAAFVHARLRADEGRAFPQVHICELARLPVEPSLLARGSRLAALGRAALRIVAGEGLAAAAPVLAEAEEEAARAYALTPREREIVAASSAAARATA